MAQSNLNTRLRPMILRPLLLAAVFLGLSGGSLLLYSQSPAHPLDAVYRSAAGGAVSAADENIVLRRMSLQIRGVIPSLREVREFEAMPQETRLQTFAVRFLRDADYAHYWATVFGEALREQSNFNRTKYGSYFDYLAKSLHENKPYDVMTRELLTATGTPDKNPAANFYIRDDGDPLQVAEYVGRVFYGARLNCARCHDHPFRKDFTRRDYYGFAAFFSQAWVRKNQKNDWLPKERMEHFPTQAGKEYQQKRNDWYRNVWNKMSKAEQKRWREKNKLEYAEVAFEEGLSLRFPHTDYAPGGDLVKPLFPDGTRAFIEEGEDRRAVFARWLTAKENDRFRKVLINRVWTRLMGWSFFTPLDDWQPDTKIKHPELLEHLDQVFLEKKYRIKDLILYIATSEAYARSAPGANTPEAERESIAYFQPQRMDASQLFNSLLRGTQTAKTNQIWERANVDITVNDQKNPQNVDLTGMGALLSPEKKNREYSNACEIPRPAHDRTILAVFGEGERNDVDDSSQEATIDQVLALLNGRMTGSLVRKYGDKDTFIAQEYAEHQDMAKSIETVYQSLLSRKMSKGERDVIVPMTESRFMPGEQFNRGLLQDVVWAIVVSQEFIHVH